MASTMPGSPARLTRYRRASHAAVADKLAHHGAVQRIAGPRARGTSCSQSEPCSTPRVAARVRAGSRRRPRRTRIRPLRPAGRDVSVRCCHCPEVDHHSPVGLLTLRLAPLARRGHRIVDDFSARMVTWRPGSSAHPSARPPRPRSARSRSSARRWAVTADVEHQPGPGAGLPVHGQPGQLLQRLQNRAVVADQFVQRGADDRHHRPVTLDIHVNVAVQVRDVQQAFHVVRGDIALELEIAQLGGVTESTQAAWIPRGPYRLRRPRLLRGPPPRR